jgi:(R)-2-hydroxyacyl-CoA dehydratese activating ATPase
MITAGVDIGSVATKGLVLHDGRVLATALRSTGSRPKLTAETVLEEALSRAGRARAEVQSIVSTGYGRRVVEFGDRTITEISACGLGARFLGSPRGPVRTVIDLGGQDIKVIALGPDGGVEDFLMNDKCAAGTGRFLEVIAQALEVPLEDLGELSLRSGRPVVIDAACTVFAESEVISLLARDTAKEDILAGIHRSIADRIAALAGKLALREIVTFNGGGARNPGLVAALESKLGVQLHVPKDPQYVNALGAALEAAGWSGRGGENAA